MTKKNKKSRQVKAASEGFEGFVDWTNLAVIQSAEKREAKMFGLIARFAIWMRKRAANA